ncbi:MAG: hypothetical protein QNM02_12710 [Acidimicrobiia bacterium]|nr:hypothetical protein [Acidimicrobiia bacterium]
MRSARYPSIVLAAVVLVAACGSGGDDGSEGASDETDSITPDDEASDGTGDRIDNTSSERDDPSTEFGAIDGVLVSLLSPDLGLYAVDRDTGEHRALTLDGVEYVDRDVQPISGTSSAFTVSLTTREGQSFSHDLGLARVDLDSGGTAQIAGLGADRETDDSADLTDWEVLATDDSVAWLETRAFTGEGAAFVGFDAATGEEVATFDDLDFEITTDDGSTCSGSAESLLVLDDGTLVTTTSGWPAELDQATGDLVMMLDWCGFGVEPTLADFVNPAEAADWFITEDGSAVTAEAAESRLPFIPLRAVPSGGRGLTAGDGSIWWLFVSSTSVPSGDESISAYTGGVVRFDPAIGAITNVWPLGEAVATYLPGEDDADDITTVSTMSSFDLRFLDGALWIMDHRDDAPLRRLDPATGEITEITIDKGDVADLTDAEMIFSDPLAIWLDVTRKVVTSDDENGRSTSGAQFIERVDTSTGSISISVPAADILGF